MEKEFLLNLMNKRQKKIIKSNSRQKFPSGIIVIPRIWMNAFNVDLSQKIKFDITKEGYLVVIPIRTADGKSKIYKQEDIL